MIKFNQWTLDVDEEPITEIADLDVNNMIHNVDKLLLEV